MRMLLSTLGTAGDIIPFVHVARALLARGHRVTVHCSEEFGRWFPDECRVVAAAGSLSAQAQERIFEQALHEPNGNAQKFHFSRMFYGLGDGDSRAQAYYAEALRAFEGHDLALINTLDHIGQAAAECVGLPWACYASRPPPSPDLADPFNIEIDAAVSELLARVTGRSRFVRSFRTLSPLLTLVACSPHLAPAHPNKSVKLTGAWLGRPSDGPLPHSIEQHLSHGPTLFTTFGTMPEVNERTAALLRGASASGWRVIVQVLSPASLPTSLPAGALVTSERLEFSSLFRRVAGVVHHGSVGTTHEVLRAGKPSLVIPHMGDQFFWGMMLAERHVSPRPVRFTDISPSVIATRMRELRDATFVRAAAELGAIVAEQDGIAEAVAHLESALDDAS